MASPKDSKRAAAHGDDTRLNEERLRLLAESVREYAVVLLEPDGSFATWNPGAEQITGYKAEEILGRSFSQLFVQADRDAKKPERQLKIAALEGRLEDEGWRARKDGSLLWASAIVTALKDGPGGLVGYGLVLRDQTPRRVAEDRLRRSEERLRLMIEAVKDYAIFMLDPQGRIESWNPGAQRLKGYAAEEIVGRHFSVFYPKEAVESGWPEHELKVAAAAGRFEDEGWRVRKDGSRMWASVVISAIRSPSGELLGFTKVTRDLTERRQREEELRRALEDLRKSNAELDEYAAFVSHDLQEPLRKMAGFSELVERRYKDALDEDGRKFLRYIVDGASRMRALIVDVLDYSRLGRLGPEFTGVDLGAVVDEQLGDLQPAVRESGARVSVGRLPRVRGNAQLLGRLVLNLLSNALKFRDPKRAPEISLKATVAGGECVLVVEDNGIGFERAEAHQIMRPFVRLHPKEAYPGTGLGLAMVKKIAEMHGGRVWAESEPGKGSRFFVALPCEGRDL